MHYVQYRSWFLGRSDEAGYLCAGRVLYWDLVEERIVESFKAHAGVVSALAMHPKSECLLTASTDGTIRVWQ